MWVQSQITTAEFKGFNVQEEIGVPAPGRFHDVGRFFNKNKYPRIGPEVTVGCLGVVSTHYNFIRALPRPFRTKIA